MKELVLKYSFLVTRNHLCTPTPTERSFTTNFIIIIIILPLKEDKWAKPWKLPKKRYSFCGGGGDLEHIFLFSWRVKVFCQCVNIDHVFAVTPS